MIENLPSEADPDNPGKIKLMEPLVFATQAKGGLTFLKRVWSITRRYGLTPARMDRALCVFTKILQDFQCGASFALLPVALKRNPAVIAKHLDQNIEFIIHGYTHIDYTHLPSAEQVARFTLARQVFAEAGVPFAGYRSPYLRRSARLNESLETVGFSYTSNQTVLWEVLDKSTFHAPTDATYKRALNFYTPWLASQRVSLPHQHNNLVEIPVSLPDDEILIDRLSGDDELVKQAWLAILEQTYAREELFTIQLHPERTFLCKGGLVAVLTAARSFTPSVWIARLDEMDAWWRARAAAQVEVAEITQGGYHVVVTGDPRLTVLARGVEVAGEVRPWMGGDRRVMATTFDVRASSRPVVGVSAATAPLLVSFLRQAGYIVQQTEDRHTCAVYLDRPDFDPEDERELLTQIEQSGGPLIRLGRWPDGARSALCITGDIDALTLWDYAARIFGQ